MRLKEEVLAQTYLGSQWQTSVEILVSFVASLDFYFQIYKMEIGIGLDDLSMTSSCSNVLLLRFFRILDNLPFFNNQEAFL